MATTFTTNLALPQVASGDTGWGNALDNRLAALDYWMSSFAVRASDVSATTGLATSLNYAVAGGYFPTFATFNDGATPTLSAGTTGIAADNATTYLWLNTDGTFGVDTAGYTPTEEPYRLIARIVAASGVITRIIDDSRTAWWFGASIIGGCLKTEGIISRTIFGGTETLAPTRTSSRTQVRCDCSGAACTVKLPSIGPTSLDFTAIVKKIDNTSNPVTVQAQTGDLIDGASSKTITVQYGVLRLYSSGFGTWDLV